MKKKITKLTERMIITPMVVVLFLLGSQLNAQTYQYDIFATGTGTTQGVTVNVGQNGPTPPSSMSGQPGGATLNFPNSGLIENLCTTLDNELWGFGFPADPASATLVWDDLKDECPTAVDGPCVESPPACVTVDISVGLVTNFSALTPTITVELNGQASTAQLFAVTANNTTCDPALILTYCLTDLSAYNVNADCNGSNSLFVSLVPGGAFPTLGLKQNPAWAGAVARVTADYCRDIEIDFTCDGGGMYTFTNADLASMAPACVDPLNVKMHPTNPSNPNMFTCTDLRTCTAIEYFPPSCVMPPLALPSVICRVNVTAGALPPPIAVCKDATISLDGLGQAWVKPESLNDGSMNCNGTGTLTFQVDMPNFPVPQSQGILTCEDIGDNIVTLIVTNEDGCVSTCESTVTIEDNIAPTVFCPGNKTLELAGGACGSFPTEGIPNITDNCGTGFTIIPGADNPAGDVFVSIDCATGESLPQMYSYTVEDASGNESASCSYTVVYQANQNATAFLKCNDFVNVAANVNCSVILDDDDNVIGFEGWTADMFLEGSGYGCFDCYQLTYEQVYNPNVVFELKVTVTDPATGNSCWSQLIIEDSTDPFLIDEDADDFNTVCGPCSNINNIDPDHPDYDFENCVLNCAELKLFKHFDSRKDPEDSPGYGQFGFDFGIMDDLIPSDADDFIDDFVDDNCGQPMTASFTDIYDEPSDCTGSTLLTRTWTVNFLRKDGSVGAINCERFYRFNPLRIIDENGPIIIETSQALCFDTTFIDLIDPITGEVILDANGDPVQVIDEITGFQKPQPRVDTIVMPLQLVEVPSCNIGISPIELMALFDIDTDERNGPADDDKDTDDNGIDPDEFDIDCVIEANEGVAVAFPHYFIQGQRVRNFGEIHPQPVNNEVCNIIVDYWDTPLEACAPGCSGNSKILRTWTLLDWCTGEFFEYNQTIKQADENGPTIVVEVGTYSVDPWKCVADINLPAPKTLVDDCDNEITYSIGFVEGALTVSGNAVDGYVIHDVPVGTTDNPTTEVEYVAEDCCGNRSATTVSLSVSDLTDPVPVTKQNIVIELVGTANTVPGIAKLYAEDVDNGSYDSCSDVEIEIRRAPVCSEEDAEWGDHVKFCCEDLDGATVDPITETLFTLIDVELRVVDKAGNENILWTTVRLEDKAGGAVVCPPSLVVNCLEPWTNIDYAGGVPVAFSTCEEIPIGVDTLETIDDTRPRRKPDDEGPLKYLGLRVPAGDNPCGYYIPELDVYAGAFRRDWAFTDSEAECEQWIVVEYNNVEDVDITWPDDVEVDCDDYETGEPTWTEVPCDLIGYSVETDTFMFEADACVKIINEWTVINWCTFIPTDPDKNNVDDFMDADGDGIRNSIDISDSGEVDVFGNDCIDGIPCATDEGDDDIPGTADDEFETFFDQFDPTVEDNGILDGLFVRTQVIKVIDTEKPEIQGETGLCFDATEACEKGKGVSLSATGTDNGECGSAWIGWEISVDAFDDWNIDFMYSSNFAPTVNGDPNPFYVAKSSSGEAINIVLPDSLVDAWGKHYAWPASKSQHRIDWKISDGCGNTNEASTYFTIEDKKAPTPYCLNLSTAVMANGEVELWAIDFNRGSFDNCTNQENLLYTFTNVPPPPRCDEEYSRFTGPDAEDWYDTTFWFYDSSEIVDVEPEDDDEDCPNNGFGEYMNQDDFGEEVHQWIPALGSAGAIFTTEDVDANGFIQIPIYVWDECANIDFCLVNVRIIDNGGGAGMVAGTVRTEDEQTIEDVQTELMSNIPQYPKYEMTDDLGQYAFMENALTQDYEISGNKNDQYLNGVSTRDLVRIQRHVLGLEPLESAYKMIAADVNNDQKINGQDLIELRKLILGIYTELPQNDSWMIISAADDLTVENPWVYTTTRTIRDLASDMGGEDFIGVKIGDVDNSVELGNLNNTSTGRLINLDFEDQLVNAGEDIQIQLNTEEQMYGYQFTMDLSNVEFVGIQGEGVTTENVAIHANALTMSKASLEAVTGEMFTITLKAKTDGKVSDLISLNSSITKAEAYIGENLEVTQITLRDDNLQEFSLGQNEPNPFTDLTTIEYTLPQASKVSLTLYDVTGKTLRVMNLEGNKGMNTVVVDNKGLTAGVIYYQLDAGSFTATRHMIVIE